MTDVFVSYKAEDRERVAPLVAALVKADFAVWWDAHIVAGEEWREQIETSLEAARCVIVVWSTRSVAREGRFVRDEASRAQRRGVYLPVRIDAIEPPLGFGETQAFDLTGWKGDPGDPRLATLLAAVRAVIAQEPAPAPAPSALHRPRGVDRRLVLAGGGAAALALAGGGAWWWLRGGGSVRSIAVLPFANLSGDPAQDYFGDGLAEDLRTTLSRIDGLSVIARMSSDAVRGLDAQAAAAKLGVQTILSGSVRNSSTDVRVTAELIRGSSGVETWSDSYDRPSGDVLSIQSEIAASVAGALAQSLGAGNRSARDQIGTDSNPAHDMVLRARALTNHHEGGDITRQALALCEAALALDPNYAEAKARQAALHSDLAVFETDGAAARIALLKQAEGEARQAIALDPRGPRGWGTLAFIQESLMNYRGAFASYRQASQLGSTELSSYAFFLAELGKGDTAVIVATRGVEIDPLNPNAYSALGDAQYLARDYPNAIVALRKMLQLAPDRYYAHFYIALSLMWLGRLAEAQAELKPMPANDRFRATAQVAISIRQHDQTTADRVAATLLPNTMLRVFADAQRGAGGAALDYLEKALATKDPDISAVFADPLLNPLRGEPRFKALIGKLDLP